MTSVRIFNLLFLCFVIPFLFTSCITDDGCGQNVNTNNINKDQLQADLDAIEAYLSENNIEAKVHKSGIRYVINSSGNGNKPTLCNQVTVNYEGRLMSDGSLFDDANGKNIAFPLSGVIKGWQIGIPQIKEGGKIQLYIPSVYAYGSRGSSSGSIPPNSNLIFEVNLVKVF